MAGPFIHIATYSIKVGKLDQCRQGVRELVDLVETNEPRLIAFNVYLDEEGRKVSIVQVHPDSASMESHLKVVAEHITGAFDYLEKALSEQTYGAASEALAEMLRKFAQPGLSIEAAPIHEAGFTRSNAG